MSDLIGSILCSDYFPGVGIGVSNYGMPLWPDRALGQIQAVDWGTSTSTTAITPAVCTPATIAEAVRMIREQDALIAAMKTNPTKRALTPHGRKKLLLCA